MGKTKVVLFSFILLGFIAQLRAGDLTLFPDVKLSVESDSSRETNANLRIYLKNNSDKAIVLPTRGFSSIVSIQAGVVSVVLLFQSDETVKGMRVVRPVAAFHPVELRTNEMAEAEFNFLWPSAAERKYPVRVTFEIDSATALKYNFWSGSVDASCEMVLKRDEPRKPTK